MVGILLTMNIQYDFFQNMIVRIFAVPLSFLWFIDVVDFQSVNPLFFFNTTWSDQISFAMKYQNNKQSFLFKYNLVSTVCVVPKSQLCTYCSKHHHVVHFFNQKKMKRYISFRFFLQLWFWQELQVSLETLWLWLLSDSLYLLKAS